MIRSFRDAEPEIDDSAYVDDAAVVIGEVRIEAEASVWPGVVLRSDGGGEIVVREAANVQDNVVCHADAPDQRVELGPKATIGHSAVVHNATVGDHGLVGMNAVVLDDAHVGEYSIVAAGSVVSEGQAVEPRTLVGGTPASVLREGIEASSWFEAGDEYVELSREHMAHSEDITDRYE